jgi:hypothetical protein
MATIDTRSHTGAFLGCGVDILTRAARSAEHAVVRLAAREWIEPRNCREIREDVALARRSLVRDERWTG